MGLASANAKSVCSQQQSDASNRATRNHPSGQPEAHSDSLPHCAEATEVPSPTPGGVGPGGWIWRCRGWMEKPWEAVGVATMWIDMSTAGEM